MKNLRRLFIVTVSLALTSAGGINAQDTRTPILEIFSSSTCPPCKPASDFYTPILDAAHDKVVVVKYPMSWPGTGDPYYTAEGNTRKSYYGVNGVPAMYANGSTYGIYSLSETVIDNWNLEPAKVRMKLKYFIDEGAHTIKIAGEARALEAITDPLRLYISINEHITYDNKKSNGETEFHNISKKLVPNQNGLTYFTGLEYWEKIDIDMEYTFEGAYRLPPNALDPIDHTTEHSVEEFSDLHVVAWVQGLASKTHYQAINGERVYDEAELVIETTEEDWATGVKTAEPTSDLLVYPNPITGEANILFYNNAGQEVVVEVTNLLGAQVARTNFGVLAAGEQTLRLSTTDMENGFYFLNIRMGSEMITKKVTVTN